MSAPEGLKILAETASSSAKAASAFEVARAAKRACSPSFRSPADDERSGARPASAAVPIGGCSPADGDAAATAARLVPSACHVSSTPLDPCMLFAAAPHSAAPQPPVPADAHSQRAWQARGAALNAPVAASAHRSPVHAVCLQLLLDLPRSQRLGLMEPIGHGGHGAYAPPAEPQARTALPPRSAHAVPGVGVAFGAHALGGARRLGRADGGARALLRGEQGAHSVGRVDGGQGAHSVGRVDGGQGAHSGALKIRTARAPKSQFVGVSSRQDGKFKAVVIFHGQSLFIGAFSDEVQACVHYDIVAAALGKRANDEERAKRLLEQWPHESRLIADAVRRVDHNCVRQLAKGVASLLHTTASPVALARVCTGVDADGDGLGECVHQRPPC
ncbi:hypothetical protein KFE25_010781 [Diacronema lutheri]|uniref:AP2/ERF domain-containing protein n=1 Tax=Diacronema lutheri TaxID=2081491 RepID=A0A8J5X8H3_DIALT|nr:hypothetical protein KFE25_010781 [Diacronema lutheri]